MLSAQPSNVFPMLTASRRPSATPLEMAAALRRLHRAGVRRSFVLVAPTDLGRQPQLDRAGAEDLRGDARWWSDACDGIRARTGLGVMLVDVAHGGIGAERLAKAAGGGKRLSVLRDLSRGERSALLELCRAVCTGHRGLLAEARALGTPALAPWELQVALRGDALGDLLELPVAEALPATA